MAKIIDLDKSVYELTQEFPEVIELMRGLGFTEITKKGMLTSVGRIMTIPKGAKMKQIDMEDIVRRFVDAGFTVKGYEAPQQNACDQNCIGCDEDATSAPAENLSRSEQLKAYLHRLNAGEDLETIREEFRQNFSDVEASEIMRAEQELLQEGTPLHEVQQLCDVHSALFHGATREEKIANAEAAVTESLNKEEMARIGADNLSEAAKLIATEGHPLQTFTKENEALAPLLQETKDELMSANRPIALLTKIREIAIHYAKKGDLLYPLLKVKYDISGPSNVMWTVDDEVRDELGRLVKDTGQGDDWLVDAAKVVARAEEMIYKETNILFPICSVNFTEEEWYGIYRDSKDYPKCLGVENDSWEEAEAALKQMAGQASHDVIPGSTGNPEVRMPGGHLTVEQLAALLNTIPMEITFVDAGNINRFFNEGEKVFKRPGIAIDREVFSCHPPKVEGMVRQIIGDFRSGERDSVPIWMEKGGRSMLVTYMAVRDNAGKYLGTVELVQDMEFAKEHFKTE